MFNLDRISSDSFDWTRWRNFDLFFCEKIICKSFDIIGHRNILKKYAMGYCQADSSLCRPKENCFAVMFLKDDIFSWCHLTKNEFTIIFGGKEK